MAYKIIQWSSGNVGKNAVATIAQRKDQKLVGLYVYSDEKNGRDAGEIAGVGRLGVKATNNRDKLLAMDADCVVHTPLPSLIYGDNPEEDLDTICALLASGKNVITTVGYLYPKSHGKKIENRITAACRMGGSSYHSTGVNPGWMGDVFPLMMSGISQKIECIHIKEITNFEFYNSPEIIFDMMGMGCTAKEFKKHTARYTFWLSGLFRESIQMVADGLNLKLDAIKETSSTELARKNITVAAGTLDKGTVAGQHWEWAGMVNRRKVIIHETAWRMHDSVGAKWPRGNHSISISGKPDMYMEFGPTWNNDVLLSTAAHAVNAVPAVCDAPSGIRTLLDLPMITARGAAG